MNVFLWYWLTWLILDKYPYCCCFMVYRPNHCKVHLASMFFNLHIGHMTDMPRNIERADTNPIPFSRWHMNSDNWRLGGKIIRTVYWCQTGKIASEPNSFLSANWLLRHGMSHFLCQLFNSSKLITSAEEGGYVFSSVCLSVCLSACLSDYSQTCERILTKFFGGAGHGSRTKCYNFGGDPDHASDPGVQSPKSGSSGSAEVCALWAYLLVL